MACRATAAITDPLEKAVPKADSAKAEALAAIIAAAIADMHAHGVAPTLLMKQWPTLREKAKVTAERRPAKAMDVPATPKAETVNLSSATIVDLPNTCVPNVPRADHAHREAHHHHQHHHHQPSMADSLNPKLHHLGVGASSLALTLTALKRWKKVVLLHWSKHPTCCA